MRRERWPSAVHGLLAALVDPAITGENTISLMLGNNSRYVAAASSQNNHASRWDVGCHCPTELAFKSASDVGQVSPES